MTAMGAAYLLQHLSVVVQCGNAPSWGAGHREGLPFYFYFFLCVLYFVLYYF